MSAHQTPPEATMAQQLREFTVRFLQKYVDDHNIRTQHDNHCCALADEYRGRLGMETSSATIPPQSKSHTSTTKTPATAPKRLITGKQADYVWRLRRKVSLELLSPEHRDILKRILADDTNSSITSSEASGLIEAMVSLADARVPRVEPTYIPELGAYLVDGNVYQVVQARESKKRYAKKFNPESGKFDYVGRAPFEILQENTRMTAEEAREFGATYHHCCSCGMKLVKKVSIEHGYGPVCAERNGWPY